MMTREEAKEVFLNRGFIKADGGTVYDGDKWREACSVISKWLEQETCEDVLCTNLKEKNDMTLDEAIKHAEEVANANERLCETVRLTMQLSDYGKCAEEHRQLAEWLKDYKRLLEQEPCEECVTKKAIKHCIDLNICEGEESSEYYKFILDELMALPPATPVSTNDNQCSECYTGEEDKPRKECEDCINMFAMKELSKLKYPPRRGDCKSTFHTNANIALDIGISAIYHSECKTCPKHKETEEEE